MSILSESRIKELVREKMNGKSYSEIREELAISEFIPIYEEDDDLELSLVRNIAILFNKMRTEDKSIFQESTESVKRITYTKLEEKRIDKLNDFCPSESSFPDVF